MAASERHTDEAGQNGSVAARTRQAQEKTTAGSTTRTRGGEWGWAGGTGTPGAAPGHWLRPRAVSWANVVEGGQGPGY